MAGSTPLAALLKEPPWFHRITFSRRALNEAVASAVITSSGSESPFRSINSAPGNICMVLKSSTSPGPAGMLPRVSSKWPAPSFTSMYERMPFCPL